MPKPFEHHFSVASFNVGFTKHNDILIPNKNDNRGQILGKVDLGGIHQEDDGYL